MLNRKEILDRASIFIKEKEYKKYLKIKFIVPTIIVIFLLGSCFGGGNNTTVETYDVGIENITQSVSISGRVKASEYGDLSFENSGKIDKIYVKVGQEVKVGQILASQSNGELGGELNRTKAQIDSANATLAQYQASYEAERAKLDELKNGSTTQELNVAQTKVENAKIALENAKNDANTTLNNLYTEVPVLFSEALINIDSAINKQIDELFTNDNSSNAKLTYVTSNQQLETDVESQRVQVTSVMSEISEISNKSNTASQIELDMSIEAIISKLRVIEQFLRKVSQSLTSSVGIESSLSTYKINVNTALTSISTSVSNINNQKISISAQKNKNNTNITTAENNLRLAESELALTKSGSRDEAIRAQESKVKQAKLNVDSQAAYVRQNQASYQTAAARYSKTILRSPISGTVTKVDIKLGEIAPANQNVISVISTKKFQIEANIPEIDIRKIQVDDIATLTLDAYGDDQKFEARVIFIDPAEEIKDGVPTYKTTFEFTSDDERIKSGMTANLVITGQSKDNVLAALKRSIYRKDDKQYVKVMDGSTTKEVEITTGFEGSLGKVEVLSGLKAGDKVILNPTE